MSVRYGLAMHMPHVGAAISLAVPAPKGKPTLFAALACKLYRSRSAHTHTHLIQKPEALASLCSSRRISQALFFGAGVATSCLLLVWNLCFKQPTSHTEQHAAMRMMETSVGSGLFLVMVEPVVYESDICTKLAHCHILFSESAKAFANCCCSYSRA